MFQKDVVDIIKQHKDVEDDLIHHPIGLLSINCVGLSFKKEKIAGRALCPLLSLMCHSCVSNARYAGKVNTRGHHLIVLPYSSKSNGLLCCSKG